MVRREVATAGTELLVEDGGGDGPALVFLHYWGGSARTWTPVLPLLPANCRPVLINQRGWGGSRVTDGRYGLEALADDVAAVADALSLGRFVLVGHSMGGKVAQLVAGRRAPGLAGLVLVAPAPPTPMDVPVEVRAGMLASYGSREGVLQALEVLGGTGLVPELREQVVEDTLRGEPGAKRSWPEEGMTSDVGGPFVGVDLPVEVVLGAEDRVEREEALHPVLARHLPQARFTLVPGCGHLVPLVAPAAVAEACARLQARIALGLGTGA